jgi:ankyrin repeat protein
MAGEYALYKTTGFLSASNENMLLIVSAGQDDIVQELLGAGADVQKTNDKGLTPL